MEDIKVVVPIKGYRVDEEALRLACSIVREGKGELYVIYVIEVPRSFSLEAEIEPEIRRGEEVLGKMERIAREEKCKIQTEFLQARAAGPALVDEAVAREVGLIVIGIPYKKRFGKFGLGDTLPYIMKHAPCSVLFCRESMSFEESETSQNKGNTP